MKKEESHCGCWYFWQQLCTAVSQVLQALIQPDMLFLQGNAIRSQQNACAKMLVLALLLDPVSS